LLTIPKGVNRIADNRQIKLKRLCFIVSAKGIQTTAHGKFFQEKHKAQPFPSDMIHRGAGPTEGLA
jgi:hypothetical protein